MIQGVLLFGKFLLSLALWLAVIAGGLLLVLFLLAAFFVGLWEIVTYEFG